MKNVKRFNITVMIVLLCGMLFTAGFHSLAVAKNQSETANSYRENVSELSPEMVGRYTTGLMSFPDAWNLHWTVSMNWKYDVKKPRMTPMLSSS